VAAGAIVIIYFINDDHADIHNLAIYTNQDATEAIFIGDTVINSSTIIYQFQAPGKGVYYFRCDYHPQTEWGTFVVQ
jgi:plastocyanin